MPTPMKGNIRQSLDSGFHTEVSDSRYWIADSLSVELRFRIPIVSGIRTPKAVFQIPKPRIPDSTGEVSRSPDSGFPYTGRPIGPNEILIQPKIQPPTLLP